MVDSSQLQKYSLFGGLLPEQIESIRALLGQEGYGPGEAIIREGEPNDRIRFVLEGRVDVSKAGVKIVEIGEGETFGELEILDVMPAAATITALRHTRVATISNRAIREVYRSDLKAFSLIIMNLARDLARRLRRMDELHCGDKLSGAI